MIHSRITAKSQTTVPLAVRRALGLGPGDDLLWEVKDNQAVLTRANMVEDDGFVANFATFTEWADEYDSVFDNL
jgi:antitoxin PrlF